MKRSRRNGEIQHGFIGKFKTYKKLGFKEVPDLSTEEKQAELLKKMKPWSFDPKKIKPKFSMMAKADDSINESADVNHDAVMDLVKKLGYESVDELKKEKNLLTKLEGLLKDFTPKQDISEDELEEDRAEDIADEVKKKGEPKSLEGEDGEKEEDKETGAPGEVAETDEVEEDKAEDIEDEVLAKGEPKDIEDKAGDKVSDDPAITKEVSAEADEVDDEDGVDVAAEEEETPAATKRIMAFEDFIKEKEVTVNKNIKYADDAEEPEDYSVVSASADALSEDDEDKGMEDEKEGDELEDKGDKKVDSEDDKEKADHYKGAVKSDDKEIDALKKDVEYDKEEEDKNESKIMSFSSFVNEAYDRVVLGGNKGDKSKTHDGEDFEDEDDKKEESVEEAIGEVITKVEGDEIADEIAGDDGIAIPVIKGDGPETAAGIAGDTMERGKPKNVEGKGKELITPDQKVTEVIPDSPNDVSEDGIEIPLVKEEEEVLADDSIAEKFRKLANNKLGKVNEAEIKSADQFKEYAMKMLKDAFGDDFDETKATETADGLIDKYGEDYGAMVGALQSTMGS